MRARTLLRLTMGAAAAFCVATASAAQIPYRGVNLSGAESGGCTKPAKYGFTYIYPSAKEFDHFIAQGMNTFRIPFCWERLQPAALGEFDAAEFERLDKATRYATGKGAYVVLDPHNYGRYWGKPVTSDDGSAAFADMWRRLAARYKNDDHVLFGLMNEPNGVSSEAWLKTANAGIAAIRDTGAKNLILVPGVAWTGAHSWTFGSYGTPNGVAMLQVDDPANNYVYEVHQYLDKDSSGTTSACVAADIGRRRLAALHAWLQANDKKAFLGEFGGAKSDICYAAVADLLAAIHEKPELWAGWTYWAAGPWLGHYMFALPLANTPPGPSQLDVLKPFLTTRCRTPECLAPAPPKMYPVR